MPSSSVFTLLLIVLLGLAIYSYEYQRQLKEGFKFDLVIAQAELKALSTFPTICYEPTEEHTHAQTKE